VQLQTVTEQEETRSAGSCASPVIDERSDRVAPSSSFWHHCPAGDRPLGRLASPQVSCLLLLLRPQLSW